MKDEHSYQITKVKFEENMPIRIYPWGAQRTDVFTPMAYLHFKIEARMKKADQLMIKYIDNYLRKREKLQNEFALVYPKTKDMAHFEILSGFTPEEGKEYDRLCQESRKRLLHKEGSVK